MAVLSLFISAMLGPMIGSVDWFEAEVAWEVHERLVLDARRLF